jgi:hypothetical protein
MLTALPIPTLPLALSPPPRGLCPPNSWVTLLNPLSALPLKQSLLFLLLSLIRVLLYSSPCRAFCRPLSSHLPPTSITTFPLPSLLRCPNACCRETLMSTFVLTAFALHHQPLVERSCRVYPHVDPDAPCHRCCCCCCCCRCLSVIVVIGITIVLFTATPTIVELMPPVDPLCCHFPPRQQAHLCLLSFILIVM